MVTALHFSPREEINHPTAAATATDLLPDCLQSATVKQSDPVMTLPQMNFKERINILWFRNGLRLHDNESLKIAARDKSCKLLPIFIFDGETPTTKHCKYNKILLYFLSCCIYSALWSEYCYWVSKSSMHHASCSSFQGGKIRTEHIEKSPASQTISRQRFSLQVRC